MLGPSFTAGKEHFHNEYLAFSLFIGFSYLFNIYFHLGFNKIIFSPVLNSLWLFFPFTHMQLC